MDRTGGDRLGGCNWGFGLRIERTEDMAFVNSLLQMPGVVETAWDDGGPKTLSVHPSLVYLRASIEVWDEGAIRSEDVGCMTFIPINAVTWNPHIAILPEHRGKGTETMKAGIEWMLENTGFQKLVAYPPEYNKPMIRVFEKCGFKCEGYSPASILKNGVLHGRYLMGRGR